VAQRCGREHIAPVHQPARLPFNLSSRGLLSMISGLFRHFGGLVLFVSAAVAYGAAGDDPLAEVIVVATRLPVSPDKVGNAFSVLDQKAIVQSQAVLASDLLATLPGLTMVRNGGPGAPTAVRIRGAEADETLVLIDGVQMNDPSDVSGGFDFGNLLVGDISRIEVLRGPQSTLYGSQAIGGVINIVTAEPQGALARSASVEYGSMNSSQLKAGVGGQSDRVSARLAGSYYRTDGVSSYAGGTETDRFRNSTFAGRFGYELTPSVALDLRAFYADGRSSYDGFPPPFYSFADTGDFSKNRQFIGYAGVNFALAGGRLQNRVAYQQTSTDRDTFSGPVGAATPSSRYKGENQRIEYQGSWNFAQGYTAVFGGQHEKSQMHSDLAPTSAEVNLDSFYAQLQAELIRGLTLIAGDRFDDHDTFGSHHSPRIAAAWSLGTGTILRASWGEGFKAPTLYQLYSDYRNPDLAAESSRGWDAGVAQRFMQDRVFLRATWFQRSTRNRIGFGDCPDPGTTICSLPGHSSFGYYANVARNKADGIELEGSFAFTGRTSLSANYAHTRSEDRSPGAADFGRQLLRRPKNTANATLTYGWPRQVDTSLAVRYVSASADSDFNVFPAARVTLSDYTLVDLRLAWPVTESMKIAARVENLFDRQYQTVLDYGTTGRAGYLSVSYRF
jgi:vitamin B12 transporter